MQKNKSRYKLAKSQVNPTFRGYLSDRDNETLVNQDNASESVIKS